MFWIFVASLFWLSCSDYEISKIPDEPVPDITVEPMVIDYGVLFSGRETGVADLVVTNIGTDDLNIGSVSLIADDQTFDVEYEQAACNGIMAFLDDARKAMETAEGRDEILKHKELLRHAEWLAEKRLAIFQPATRAEVKIDGPMVVGWNTIEGVANVLSNDQVDARARTLTNESRAALPAAE